jgi:uncharacterized membrane protein YphA (DoxX/SURF4 family)
MATTPRAQTPDPAQKDGADVPQAQQADVSSNPMALIQAALPKVPAVKFALGVASVAGAASIAIGYFESPAAALIAAIGMLGLMVVLFVFSKLVASKRRMGRQAIHQERASIALMWFCLLLFFMWTGGLTLSVFANWPEPLPNIIGRLFGTREETPSQKDPKKGDQAEMPSPEVWTSTRKRLSLSELPLGATVPEPTISLNRANQAAVPIERPDIVLDRSTLVLAPGTSALFARKLTLKNGARIVTNGSDFTLQATSIESVNGEPGKADIVSFEEGNTPIAPTASGQPGANGAAGGSLTINGALANGSRLVIDLKGQDGGTGARGAEGRSGPAGANGVNGSDSLLDCRRSGGDGLPGGAGENGGIGGPGGNGGDGGHLRLLGAIATQLARIEFSNDGGKAGQGGPGGVGGPGGRGGLGGNRTVFCGGGSPGPQGVEGAHGVPGRMGEPGKPGKSPEFSAAR